MRNVRYHLALALAALLAAGAGCAEVTPPELPGGPPRVEKHARILSLTPNVTEVLFAMGLGDDIVGRSTYCSYPPEAKAIPIVGDTLQVNQEKIIKLNPTIAFAITRREDVPRALKKLGVRCVTLNSDTLPQLYESIRMIGRETDRADAAEALIRRLETDLNAVRRRVALLKRPKVLFAFPMTIGSVQMMVAGRGTFVDGLLDAAGADNAYPDAADWPTVSPQKVIAMAPDIVIVNATGDDAAPDRIEAVRRAWANWTSVPAVRNGRVVILTESYLTINGPRVGQAAARLADVIHPPEPDAAAPAKPPAAPAAKPEEPAK